MLLGYRLTFALTLILVASATAADPRGADAATVEAGVPLRADVHASDAAALVTVPADASRGIADVNENQVRKDEETGVFLGQLVTLYLDSYD